jgi:hypothetical protein
MKTIIAVVFSILFLLEGAVLFFMANKESFLTPLIIWVAVACACIWAIYVMSAKFGWTHPILLMCVAFVIIGFLLFFVIA